MPYPLRVEFPGACYHVINRGNYRRNLFDLGGAEAFERTLEEAAIRFGWLIHAYVILLNHFHLALQLTEPNLSAGMQWLQATWIRRTNVFRHLVGRPFQGRHKAILVEPGGYFRRVCNYVHLNPARGGIVTPENILTYPFSSLPRFQLDGRPDWLCPVTSLQNAGGLPDTIDGWMEHTEFLKVLAGDKVEQREMTSRKLSRGWCIGSPEFKRDMHALAIEQKMDVAVRSFGNLSGEELKHEKQMAWERKLTALALEANIDLGSLPTLKSHASKSALAAAMKLSTSVSNKWLAERLAMGKPNSANQFSRRWLLDPVHRAATEALLERLKR